MLLPNSKKKTNPSQSDSLQPSPCWSFQLKLSLLHPSQFHAWPQLPSSKPSIMLPYPTRNAYLLIIQCLFKSYTFLVTQGSPCVSSKSSQRNLVHIDFSSMTSQSTFNSDHALGNIITYCLAQLLGSDIVFKVPGGPACGRSSSATY